MRRLHLALAALLTLLAWLPTAAPAALASESAPIELGQGTKAQSLVFDRDGNHSEYPLLHTDSQPKAIVRSSTGALWFSEEGGQRLGRLYPGGTIVEFDVPGNVRGTGALAAGADGTIFFVTGSERAWIEIGSFSSDEKLTGLGCVSAGCDLPVSALTVGPEGSLWYGTDVAYYGGGGGGALLRPYFPGTVGRFDPPRPAAVSVPRQALPVRGRFIHPTVACRDLSEVSCVGRVRLEARFPGRGGRREMLAIARCSFFRLAAGEARRIPCKIESFAMDALRRQPLRVTLRVVIHGGLEARRSSTLRPPRRH